MDKPLTLADLPKAEEPGQPGIRVDSDGRIWIPWGMNVYKSPVIWERREYENLRRAGGRKSTASIQIESLANCSRCEILIGRGYYETELYLLPRLGKHQLRWKIICGGCATDPLENLNLSFGFCLVAHNDWSGPYRNTIVGHWQETIPLKTSHLRGELIKPWNSFLAKYERYYKAQHGSLVGLPGQETFTTWLGTQRPAPETFTDLISHVERNAA